MASTMTAARETATDGAILPDRIEFLRRRFATDPHARLMQNAVCQTTVDDIAVRRDVIFNADDSFSTRLDDWSVTNQKGSGRCWMFAGLNLLRVGAAKALDLEEFEFSQNYTMFWDKLEKANYFLEAILDTADRPADDRTVAFLLDHLVDDGGQWNMFVNLIEKHGVVPKAVMPETQSSSATGKMNQMLRSKLREGARLLRSEHAEGVGPDLLRELKDGLLEVIHRILCIHLGTPPLEFEWQWRDKDKQFKRDGRLTPIEFAERYITLPTDDYVCLVHDPRPENPYGRTYTVEYLGNMVGGAPVVYLNVEIETMKQIALQILHDGEPVWFGCDVGKQMRGDLGLWDARMFDYESVYQTHFSLTKAERLVYHETAMTHAMLFTGVDVANGAPRRWRVENSWGDERGKKGFYLMNDSWFDEHMFEIAARRSYLTPELQAALELPPVVLPAWDPMGSLAQDAG